MFIKNNLNPKGHKTSDCTIRALACATGIGWDKAFIELANEAFRLKLGQCDIDVLESVLMNKYGFRKESCKVEKGKSRPKVKDIAVQHNGSIIIARVANYVVPCMNGNYIDTWDSGEAAVYRLWVKEL